MYKVTNNLDETESTISKGEILNELTKLASAPYKGKKEITALDLLNSDISEIPCLVEPFFQKTGLACLAGSSDTGKSSILRQLAVSIAAGDNNFIGFKINQTHQSVIFVSTEDLERETAYLLARQSKGRNPETLEGLRFIFDISNLIEELDERLTTKPADAVIIDCFADAYGGDLKDTQKIRTFLHKYQELALKHDCLFLFLHHTGKRTENFEPSKNNLLSGQGFEAKMRLVIELRIDLTDPSLRHFCIVKGNYLPANFKKESYLLKFDGDRFEFTNTGERVPYEFLYKREDHDSGKEKYTQAKELKEQGFSYQQIADKMGFKSKGSITKLFDKARESGWESTVSSSVSFVSNGNNTETPQL